MIVAAVTQTQEATVPGTDLKSMISSAVRELAEESKTVNASITTVAEEETFKDKQLFAKLACIVGRASTKKKKGGRYVPVVSAFQHTPSAVDQEAVTLDQTEFDSHL